MLGMVEMRSCKLRMGMQYDDCNNGEIDKL
jgi:hypothetical protein